MKFLIKDNEIIRTEGSIPEVFEHDGQTVLGYNLSSEEDLYADGWREGTIPEYNPILQTLGTAVYDRITHMVVYPVTDIPDIESIIENRKQSLFTELRNISSEVSNLIYQCRVINEPEPEELTALITGIRTMYLKSKVDISELTIDDIFKYRLRTPELEGAIESLKAFL